ncbi:GNAT family N-acetyltransferase [Candidatus Woesearchaeota archaeon]|nr:GNAT family N-acetyltransferase [Candidatus Woesearchaeota archaeon]
MKKEIEFLKLFPGGTTTGEIAHFLNLFSSLPPEKFAVIKVSGACLEGSLDGIAKDIAELQDLGLFPTTLYGWGAKLTARLDQLGIESRFIEGDRYTDKAVIGEVKKIAEEHGRTLAASINTYGGAARYIGPEQGIITAKPKGGQYGTHNGQIIRVNTHLILKTAGEKIVPIVSPLGISEDGEMVLNINAATSGAHIVAALDPTKYLLVTSSGGVLSSNGAIINEINLRKQLALMTEQGIISGGMLKNVKEAQQSLEILADSEEHSVQIVGPENLFPELFTKKGAGTFIKLGYVIQPQQMRGEFFKQFGDLALASFGEALNKDYFPKAVSQNAQLFIERNGKGGALMIPHPGEGLPPYLDVIAVHPQYAGNGLGKELIQAMIEFQGPNGKLFWRTLNDLRKRSKAIGLYTAVADGSQTFTGPGGKSYMGFFINLAHEERGKALQYMAGKPSNFEGH